jgi:hypothetical protein
MARPAGAGSRPAWAVHTSVISWRATSKMRRASRSPSARGTGSRPVSRRSAASTARCASIGSDFLSRGVVCGWAARTRARTGPRPAPGRALSRSCGCPRCRPPHLCRHGHAASRLVPGSGPASAPAWGGVIWRPVCDGSRQRADRLLIRTARWAGPATWNRSGERQAAAARSVASHPDAGTDPGGSPPRTAVTAHSQIRSSMCGHRDPFRSVRDLGRVPIRCSCSYGIPEGRSFWWHLGCTRRLARGR